jgi:hypothetical protein
MSSCLSFYKRSIALYLTYQPFKQDFSVRLQREIVGASGALINTYKTQGFRVMTSFIAEN